MPKRRHQPQVTLRRHKNAAPVGWEIAEPDETDCRQHASAQGTWGQPIMTGPWPHPTWEMD